jgi:hypothetical protein
MAADPQTTDFTRDTLGRFVCNDVNEAIASTLGGVSPFHYIIIGGGLFGGSLASFLFGLDRSSEADNDPFPRYHSRILVLEAGPFVFSEHSQNLAIGLFPPDPSSIAELRKGLPPGQQRRAQKEVWGIPWHSDQKFVGQAYNVGGKGLFWGGWAPRFLESEMPMGSGLWPKRVVDELKAPDKDTGFNAWQDAAHQLGVDDPNDFVKGELHEVLRELYFNAITSKKISNMVPLADLPEYMQIEKIPGPATTAEMKEKMKLDAPYAVQSSTRSGFFPFNKFSSVPLMIAASRQASGASQKFDSTVLNDSRKQIMIVPQCRVIRLQTLPVSDGGVLLRVVRIETNKGVIDVAHNAAVFFAVGAIEGARLALDSLPGIPGGQHVGKNLMAHVRTNARFVVSREHKVNGVALFDKLKIQQIEMSGVQLRGRIKHPDNTQGHFHLQVVASGRPSDDDSDAEIFRKVPDIDQFQWFREATKDNQIGIAIRGIGEMVSGNSASQVTLDPEPDEFGIRRAFVHIDDSFTQQNPQNSQAQKDRAILNAMRQAPSEVFDVFAVTNKSFNVDAIGTTYHESGTLRMGEDASNSVVDPDLLFHGVTNTYVADTSVLPTCGSANPVQPGIALIRRLARHLAKPSVDVIPAAGMFLFKDTPTPFWRMVGAPNDKAQFGVGAIEMRSACGPFGVLWCMIPTPPNFELSLDWLSTDPTDNSGVFVRFPDPDRPPPGKHKVFTEPGAIASEYGFEIQIDAQRRGDNPLKAGGGVAEIVDPKFRGTGAMYNEPSQKLNERLNFPVFQWHTFIIRAQGSKITVTARVNGGTVQPMTEFTFNPNVYAPGDLRGSPDRGKPGKDTEEVGAKRYIGLQSHFQTNLVLYRNIFIKPI